MIFFRWRLTLNERRYCRAIQSSSNAVFADGCRNLQLRWSTLRVAGTSLRAPLARRRGREIAISVVCLRR